MFLNLTYLRLIVIDMYVQLILKLTDLHAYIAILILWCPFAMETNGLDEFFVDLLTYICPFTGAKRCALTAGLDLPRQPLEKRIRSDKADACQSSSSESLFWWNLVLKIYFKS